MQSAFRLLAASSKELLKENKGDLWDSGICRQRETLGILYKGKTLQSGQTVYWKIMVWDQDKNSTAWSEIFFWEMRLLEQKDWRGKWIGQGDDDRTDKNIREL